MSIISSTNQVRVVYNIKLHSREAPLLYKIQQFFGTGKIYFGPNYALYNVSKVINLNNIFLSHFDTYKLQGSKLENSLIWKEILLIVNTKEHLSPKRFN